jgi:hypothetical protein
MAENPMAGVSGPGPYAKRTDVGTPEMKMGSIAYGEGVETQAIKSGAPLGKTPDAVSEPSDRLRKEQAQPPVTELFAPTQRPDEPVTAGIDAGAGPGSSALVMQSKFAQRKMSDILAEMIPYDTTGEIVVLYQNALARGN